MLENAIVTRKLDLFRVFELAPAGFHAAPVVRLIDLATDPGDGQGGPELERPTWVAIELRGARGEPYPEARVRVRMPGGITREQRVRDDSTWRADDVPTEGTCEVELLDAGAPGPASTAPSGAQPVEIRGPAVGVRTGRTHLLLVTSPRPAVARLAGFLFSRDKTFVRPGAMDGLRMMTAMYSSREGAEVLVVGHTDKTGTTRHNDRLALARARAVAEFLRDDVDAWLRYYEDSAERKQRWGDTEDFAMLLAVMPEYANPTSGDPSFEGAVRAFQQQEGLEVSGTLDEEGRRALIGAYMQQDETTLPEGVDVVVHGCGEHFPASPIAGEDPDELDRRVEVFLFPDGIDPAPAQETSEAGSPAYAAWLDAAQAHRVHRATGKEQGTILVVTDVGPSVLDEVKNTYRLVSEDSSYDRTLSPREGRQSELQVHLEFTDVPTDKIYSLYVTEGDGTTTTAFERVPYALLGRISNPDEELSYPPSI